MRKRTLPVLILALLFALCLPAQAQNVLLLNPGFEELAADEFPVGWTMGMWYESGASFVQLSDDAYEGAYSAMIESVNPNDARFEQTVQVEPSSYYRIAGMVKAANCGTDNNGAGLSIKDTFVSSDYVYDTGGEWVLIELYGQTGADQGVLTVMARVGGYGSENTGTAWFDALEMEKLDAPPMGVEIHDFTVPERTSSAPETEAERDYFPMTLAIGLLFLLIAGILAFYISSGKLRVSFTPPVATRYLALVLAVAFVLRLIISMLIRGYPVDMNCFESWAATMAEVGPISFYETTSWCDYPPGYMYVLWFAGSMIRVFSLGEPINWLVIKLVPMLMDICAGLLIFQVTKKHVGQMTAALLTTLYVFNPATVVNSAAWGQVDAVLAILLALAMSEAIKKRWFISLPAFAAAVLIKPQALMVAPLGLLVIVLEGIRLYRAKEKPWKLLGALAGAVALFVLLVLPFMANKEPNAILWLYEKYTGTMNSYPYITVNACNLYTLLGLNWTAIADAPVMSIIAWVLFALSYAYAGFLYIKAKDTKRLFLACAVLLTMLFTFGAMMHERYAFPALIMLVIAYAIDRDSRLMAAILLLSFTQFMNTALVLENTHLLGSMNAINYTISILNICLSLLLAWTGFDLCVRGRSMGITRVYKPQAAAARTIETDPAAERLFRPKEYRMRLRQVDYLLMIGLTVVYAAFAFLNLGSTQAPQTSWTSSVPGEQVTFDLGETETFHLTYYGGICNTSFTVEFSEDGERWSDPMLAQYNQGQIFRWLWYVPGALDENNEWAAQESGYPMQTARYARLTSEWSGLILHEVAFLDANAEVLPIVSVHSSGGSELQASDPKYLVDEQETVPPHPSYFNSTYFDEIYHARTAYEHLNGLHAYETTHPPLGKILIMLGVQLFGMTPFGWRFMGALFGALMIPLMYLLAKQLVRRPSLSFIAAFLMAVDCMHFTQTRIATIDTYGVFFIMLMYLFMLRYSQMNFHTTPLWRTLIPLGLCGVSMGLAIASKWIGIYAATGLAFMLLLSFIRRFKEYRFARKNLAELDGDQRKVAQRVIKLFPKNLSITIGFCVVMFIIVPLVIYFFAYYPQLAPDGKWTIQGVIDTQTHMLSYHSQLVDDHSFQSPWYEWPLIVKPMWYYDGNDFMPEGVVSSISAMGNPAIWWGGLIALFFVALRFILIDYKDRRYQFVLIGFLAQYLPWVLVPRSTFIYHYFASVPFIILCTVLLFDYVRLRYPKAFKASAIAFCAVALVLFAAFYPIISGTPVPRAYAMYLKWFNWINFKYW